MKKFTFKNYVRTGRFASFQPDGFDIYLNGKKVGWVQKDYHTDFRIFLHVKREQTPEWPTDFENIQLKAQFTDKQGVKDWLKDKSEVIQKTYDLSLRG